MKLLKLSTQGKPKVPIRIGGHLHDCALGAIYMAKYKNKLIKRSVILKTIELKEQNIWAITKNNKRTTLRGLKDSEVLYLSESKKDASKWQETWCLPELGRSDTVLAKVVYLESTEKGRDGATKIMRLNEFMCESVVGLLVEKYVGSRVPHIVSTRDAWISESTGYILQDYGGTSLLKSMADLSLAEFQSIVLQSLVALACGQQFVGLKHHDLHLENVFLNRLKDTDVVGSVALKSQDTWHYTLEGTSGPVKIGIKHCGILVKIGDFGLASATDPETRIRYERVDYKLLDAGELEWGHWSGQVEGVKSYDAIVFLSKFFLDEERDVCPDEHLQWIKGLYASIVKGTAIDVSNIGRPFRGHEGNMSTADILSLPAFDAWRGPGLEIL